MMRHGTRVPTGSRRVALLAISAIALIVMAAALPALGVENPVFYDGNPDCEAIGYDGGFKIDHGAIDGTYTFTNTDGELTGAYELFPDPFNSVTIDGYISAGSELFDWTSTIGIDAVIVKGGPNANVWFYSPEAFSDTGLHAPVNDNTGKYFDISHIEFCYDYEVDVSKTANTSFDRDWTWDIDKTGSETSLTLAPGQMYLVTYYLDVWASSVDSNWAVEGTITIDNPAPFPATVETVTDEISGIGAVTVTCDEALPYAIPAFGSLECDYSSALPDGTDRTNTATVTTSGVVGGGSTTVDVLFASATITETDETISVYDPFSGGGGGYLGDVMAPEAYGDIDFQYSYWIDADALECGENRVVNTATFTTNDTSTQGSSSWTILVDVTCDDTCTLTQGYWKTHSDWGPAPYDDNWANVGGPNAPFFVTGMSWYDVFWSPPKGGNPYLILAHQWQAAHLNKLNGSSLTGAALDAYNQAIPLLDGNPMAKLGKKSPDGKKAIELAAILDSYNNGYIGPGHCDW